MEHVSRVIGDRTQHDQAAERNSGFREPLTQCHFVQLAMQPVQRLGIFESSRNGNPYRARSGHWKSQGQRDFDEPGCYCVHIPHDAPDHRTLSRVANAHISQVPEDYLH